MIQEKSSAKLKNGQIFHPRFYFLALLLLLYTMGKILSFRAG